MSPTLIADSFVSLASLLALLLFASVLRRQEPRTELIRKFLFAITLLCALMASRLLQWTTDGAWLGRLTFLLAGIVPLAALLVVEALLRHHAGRAFKIYAAGGAVLFAVLALVAREGFAPVAIGMLAGFQVLTFIGLALMVIFRDANALAPAENQMIKRLSVFFLLILPFLLTDFRMVTFDQPVRLAGLGILVLCWLALTLEWEPSDQKTIKRALVYGLCLVAAATAIAAIAQLTARGFVQVLAVLIAAMLLGAVYRQSRLARGGDEAGWLLSLLATLPIGSHQAFLDALRVEAPKGSALILEEASLGDFDDAFKAHFAKEGIAHLGADMPEDLLEQRDWFFTKFEASHAVMVSARPFRLLVLNIPALTQAKRLNNELRAIGRMATLLEAQND